VAERARVPGAARAQGADLEPASGEEADELSRLEELVRVLRVRCPWDRRQTHVSLGPHLLEECYEVLDAISDLDTSEPSARTVAHLREELGDLLVQVFFHSVLAEEEGQFTLAEVARDVHDKLVHRHPHVFGDAVAETAEDVAARWEVLKREEDPTRGVTGGIPEAMPALALAAKLLKKADALGLELPSVSERRSGAAAELERLGLAARGEQAGAGDRAVGGLLLAVVDLAVRAGIDPETALRAEARRLRRELDDPQPS